MFGVEEGDLNCGSLKMEMELIVWQLCLRTCVRRWWKFGWGIIE